MVREITTILEKKSMLSLLETGKRIDGRKFYELREIKIEPAVIRNADGSAHVFLGETEIIAGIKAEVVQPFPDMPNMGTLSVSLEITPLSAPEVMIGPPSEKAIEISRIIDRGIRESHAVKLEDLCLIPEKKVIGLFIDIYVLSDDGNLIDAAGIGALTALLTTTYKEYVAENDHVVPTGKRLPLKVLDEPVPITFAKIGDYIIVDPNKKEFELADSWLTISTGLNDTIVAVQKGGAGTFKIDEIYKCVDKSIELGKKVRQKVREVVAWLKEQRK